MSLECEFPTVIPGEGTTSIPSPADTCDDIDRGYYSTAQSYTATCPAGYAGSPVTATKAARFAFSEVSQADANTQALAAARAEAEAALVCTLIPVGPLFGADAWSSYSGSGTMYGITEFVVDTAVAPPRKYLSLATNRAGFARAATALTSLHQWIRGRTLFNTSGTLLESLFVGRGGDVETILGQAAVLRSYEDYNYTSEGDSSWTSYPPSWQRAATQKYFNSFTTAPSETALFRGWAASFGREAGVVGTSRGIRLQHPVWVTDHWEVGLTIRGDGVSVGFSAPMRAYMTQASGNTDPGVPTTLSTVALLADPGLTVNGPSATTTLTIAPDTSVRFLVQRDSTSNHKPWPEVFTSPVYTADGFERWFYFPAGPTFASWRYAEQLSEEDTWVAAMQRTPDYTTGTLEYAETTSYTGGITAGSYSPIAFDLTATTVTQGFSNLTPGATYRWTLTIQDTNLTTLATSTFTDTVDFVAAVSTDSQTYDFLAPVGVRRELVSQTVEEL